MATPVYSPWTEEPGRLQSMGSQIVRHNGSDFACMHYLVVMVKLKAWKVISRSVLLFVTPFFGKGSSQVALRCGSPLSCLSPPLGESTVDCSISAGVLVSYTVWMCALMWVCVCAVCNCQIWTWCYDLNMMVYITYDGRHHIRHQESSFNCLKWKWLSCVQRFATPGTVAHQAPLSMGFSRQECWSVLPCPPPGDLPNPGIELGSPALWKILYHLSHQGSHSIT